MLFIADTPIRWGVCYTSIRIARPPVCGYTGNGFYWKKVRFCSDESETTKILINILISGYYSKNEKKEKYGYPVL